MRRAIGIFGGLLGCGALFAAYFLLMFGNSDSLEGLVFGRWWDVIIGAVLATAYLMMRVGIVVGDRPRSFATAVKFLAIWTVVTGTLLFWHEAVARIRFSAPRTVTVNRIMGAHHALRDFLRDCGRLPTDKEGLASLSRDSEIGGWKGPYLTDEEMRDGYEQALRYRFVGDRFDVWSIGSDGIDGTDDDLRWDAGLREVKWGKPR